MRDVTPGARRLLIVKPGDTFEEVKSLYGDYDRMFAHHLGELGLEVAVVEPHKGEALPPFDAFDATIVTGSAASVTDREPWADTLASWLADAVDADKPLLGVCYGHQLLAHAKGGRVAKNPKGYEVGTIAIDLTAQGRADPLLGFVAAGRGSLDLDSTHQDIVVEIPPTATLLATSPMSRVQAFRLGTKAWAIQFHPEITEQVIRFYIDRRRTLIERTAERNGQDPAGAVERVHAGVRPTPDGPTLLRRFIECAIAAP